MLPLDKLKSHLQQCTKINYLFNKSNTLHLKRKEKKSHSLGLIYGVQSRLNLFNIFLVAVLLPSDSTVNGHWPTLAWKLSEPG